MTLLPLVKLDTDYKSVQRWLGHDRYLDSNIRLPPRLGILGLPDLLRPLRLPLVLLLTNHDL